MSNPTLYATAKQVPAMQTARLPRLDFELIKRHAVGQWVDILAAAGITPGALTKKHKPCPMCGGSDRFSFKDREGRGTYVCNQCRPQGGDGFHLLAAWLNCDFIGAMRFVADHLRITPAAGAGPVAAPTRSPAAPAERGPDIAAQRRAAKRISALWREARPVTADCPVGRYLANRGLLLPRYPAVLRSHPALTYWKPSDDGSAPIRCGEHPAMLAAIQQPAGRCIALHQTFLTADGRKADVPSVKKWTSTSGKAGGAAIRLFEPDTRLAITEGIETALAVQHASCLPVWAAVSAWGLENIEIPPTVQSILIAADHDDAGIRSAQALASRLTNEGREVRLLLPSVKGADWLDVVNDYSAVERDRGQLGAIHHSTSTGAVESDSHE
jgi:putative DNA primase/helicase